MKINKYISRFLKVAFNFAIITSLFTFVAQAESPRLEQLTKNSSSQITSYPTFSGRQNISCSDVSGQIDNVTVSLSSANPASNIRVWFVGGYTVYSDDVYNLPGGSPQQDYTFHFSQPIDVADICAGQNDLRLTIGGSNHYLKVWGSAENTYRDYSYYFGLTDGNTTMIKDMYFIINDGLQTNQAPVFDSVSAQTIDENQTLSFIVHATDPDNDSVQLSVSGLPSGASFEPLTGNFSWVPSYNQAGNYSVQFTAADNGTPVASSTMDVPITVVNVNRAPVLADIGDKMVDENHILQFSLIATDPDNDMLAFGASNLPAGATFDPLTGTFSWTPSYGQSGNYTNIEFSATDNGNPMQLDTKFITITVNHVNRPPAFDPIGSQEVPENNLLNFIVSATDPDNDSFVLSVDGLPSGATFDSATGEFSWTPNNAQAGSYVVVFSATDNGTPVTSSALEVAITVGDVPTPTEQADNIIDIVITNDFPTEIENSYLANLRKIPKFIEDGKITPAINQLNAFIQKVGQDMVSGLISQTIGDELIALANALKNDLN
jgi:hypothetical protein